MSIEHAVILAVPSPNHSSGLTKTRPHAMLPALGKPIIVRVMNQLLEYGIGKFIVVVGLNEGSVASYLKTNWVPHAEVEFVLKSDYESLSSTLSQIARKLDKEFFVVNYHTFAQPQLLPTVLNLAGDYSDSLILAGADTTLSKIEHKAYVSQNESGNFEIGSSPSVDMDSGKLVANMAICGRHFIEFLKELPKKLGTGSLHQQFVDILQLYTTSTNPHIILRKTAWIMQVNSDADLMLLNYQLLEDGVDAHILSEIPSSVQIKYPIRIDPGVSIGQSAVIGPFVYLESGSSIGMGSKISRSLVLRGSFISPYTNVEHVIIAPDRSISSQVN